MATLLKITGLAASPREFDFQGLAALPGQVPDISTLLPGRQGGAVRLAALLEAVRPLPQASYITLESTDGSFSASVPLQAVAERSLIAYRLGAGPLPAAQGGPARFFIPNVEKSDIPGLDACANVKSLGRIHLSERPGRDLRAKRRQAGEALRQSADRG